MTKKATLLFTAALLASPALAAQGLLPQPQDLGFQNGAEWIPLEVDGSQLGVRFDPALSEIEVRELIQRMPALAAGQAASAVYFPGHTVYLDSAPGTGPAAALAAAAAIRELDGVLSASPRLYAGEDPYYLTEEILVRWLPQVEHAGRERLTAGLTRTASLDYAVNPGEVYRVPRGADPLAAANALAASGLVEFAIPDFQLYRVPYATTNDPLYSNQWHLESTGQGGALPDADIDVEGAWDLTRGHAAVTIAVVDTGVELNHPDLRNNFVQGIDVLDNDNDPRAMDYLFGLFQESHATAVSGVAAGDGNNGIGVSGVAQDCTIMPIRFLSEYILKQPTVQDEADAFNFACQNGASVINNSWGPVSGAPLPASTKAAIDNCYTFGRGGKGTVIFFAAGNSNSNNSNNGYVTYERTISVTACTSQEKRSNYSSYGPTTDVCAPSDGGGTAITTTDRLGAKGYAGGDYTNSFGGTSSASPCAAGVMLLVLTANFDLRYEQARTALRATAQKIDLAGGSYNSAGWSPYYGWGRVNAAAAVATAARMDSFTLSGSSTGNVGGSVSYSISGAPPNSPWQLLYSTGLRTSPGPSGEVFDVGDPYSVAASGTTSGAGAASWTSPPLPPAAAGLTVYVEAAAQSGGAVYDSNLIQLTIS